MYSVKILFSLILILVTLSACEKITDTVTPPDTSISFDAPLTVMTYNVYVGASAESILDTTNLLEIPRAVTDMYNQVIASDFPARAKAIVKSIQASQPHLIGLQEISLVRRQTPGDRIAGGEVPAETVILDFLEILLAALQAEDLNYKVAAKVQNIDIEMPMFSDTGVDDIRLTDYDVILARSDVEVSRSSSQTYPTALLIEPLNFSVPRGYTAIDATISGVTYRVVNTHLEAFAETIRIAQTHELIQALRDETLPIILLGDFNTAAPDGTAYQILLSDGYVDTWQMPTEGTGNTCCQAAMLENQSSQLTKRIDQIFVKNFEVGMPIITHTVGDKPSDLLPSGLWPSDHAGVVAHLPIP